jgi:hypothetical protein
MMGCEHCRARLCYDVATDAWVCERCGFSRQAFNENEHVKKLGQIILDQKNKIDALQRQLPRGGYIDGDARTFTHRPAVLMEMNADLKLQVARHEASLSEKNAYIKKIEELLLARQRRIDELMAKIEEMDRCQACGAKGGSVHDKTCLLLPKLKQDWQAKAVGAIDAFIEEQKVATRISREAALELASDVICKQGPGPKVDLDDLVKYRQMMKAASDAEMVTSHTLSSGEKVTMVGPTFNHKNPLTGLAPPVDAADPLGELIYGGPFGKDQIAMPAVNPMRPNKELLEELAAIQLKADIKEGLEQLDRGERVPLRDPDLPRGGFF